MNIHIKIAIFSGSMAVITGAAALLISDGPLALFQLFLCAVNTITTTANIAVYRIRRQYQKDRATLEASIASDRAAMINALNS